MSVPDADLRERACETLSHLDPALARACAYIGVPDWRAASCEYQTLARTVTFQLISTRAADVIWGRLLDWAQGDLTAEKILTADPDTIRACGLSGPKVRHMISIAEAVSSGALPLGEINAMTDAEARKCLIAVKGIGPWTAELFLMCSLNRMDAFPEGDVGLMEAHRLLSDAETRLISKDFQRLAETWRPYRGMAAHLLWGYLNQKRSEAS